MREKEVTEFSSKLRKLEADFLELKKQIASANGSPSKDI
jgi:ribosomal protein L29